MKGHYLELDGHLLTKEQCFDIYNNVHSILTITGDCAPHDDIWIVSGVRDKFNGETVGCLDMKTGTWQYFPEDSFDWLFTVDVSIFVRAYIIEAFQGPDSATK